MRNAGTMLGALLVLIPFPAQAHLVGVELGGFYSGALHVFAAVDYIAALLALICLAALQGHDKPPTLILGAALGLLVGAIAGSMSPGWSGAFVVFGICAGIGALGALALRLPHWIGAAVGGLAGAGIGLSNGTAVAQGGVDLTLFVSGVTAAGSLALLMGSALGIALMDRFAVVSVGLRVLSGWIVAFGLIAATTGALNL